MPDAKQESPTESVTIEFPAEATATVRKALRKAKGRTASVKIDPDTERKLTDALRHGMQGAGLCIFIAATDPGAPDG